MVTYFTICALLGAGVMTVIGIRHGDEDLGTSLVGGAVFGLLTGWFVAMIWGVLLTFAAVAMLIF